VSTRTPPAVDATRSARWPATVCRFRSDPKPINSSPPISSCCSSSPPTLDAREPAPVVCRNGPHPPRRWWKQPRRALLRGGRAAAGAQARGRGAAAAAAGVPGPLRAPGPADAGAGAGGGRAAAPAGGAAAGPAAAAVPVQDLRPGERAGAGRGHLLGRRGEQLRGVGPLHLRARRAAAQLQAQQLLQLRQAAQHLCAYRILPSFLPPLPPHDPSLCS
jgi:hypothetical protein